MSDLRPVWPDAPRYGPDLPLPRHRYLPGVNERPTTSESGFLRGIDLFHAGFLWESHEAWEEIWKESTDAVDRDFLQGLIQLAAALLKKHVGNERGARVLTQRSRERLERVPAHCRGVDVAPQRAGSPPFRWFGAMVAG